MFVIKRDKEGNASRHKARLVAREFEQIAEVDFVDSYAPVARIDSIRFLIALCAEHLLHMKQFDISAAYLYGELEEKVYMHPPEGVKLSKNKCLQLVKSLYGLRQAPRAWHSKLSQVLQSVGFQPLQTEPCIFIDKNKQTYVCTNVDDGLICGRSPNCCNK